jgi:hypothetical protein
MKDKTLAEIARENNLTQNQIKAAGKAGVDAKDPEQLAAWLAKKRHRVQPGAKLATPDGEELLPQTLEEMEHAIRCARDIDSVKILKEKVAALKGIVSVQMETRELVPVGEVRQSMTRVVSAARGEFLKLAADLPPRIEGMEAAAIQKVIQGEVIEVLTRLSDEMNALYAEESGH